MINTIISSSLLILILLTIRFVFKGRINPMVQYGLWSLAALRLAAFNLFDLHPVESAFSVMNAVNSAEATIRSVSAAEQVIASHGEAEAMNNAALIMDHMKTGAITSGEGIPAAATVDWQLVILIVWAAGAFTLGLWLIHVNHRFGKRITENRKLLMSASAGAKLLPVYVSEGLDSPCLAGHRGKAAIYMPPEIAADQVKFRFAIAHELCHYKHHDLIWAIVRGVLLAFYWFNPLVWAAAIMSKRDCELACDYSVLKEIGKEDRLAYGRTLVDLIRQSDHKSDVFQMATTMYGSANGIKERISMIVKNKKMKAVTLIAVLLIVIAAVGCTFTAAPDPLAPDQAENTGIEDKAEIEAFAQKWANAYSDRDADTIYSLSENEELYLTIGEIGENEKGKYYWMGMSSPWPWNKDHVINIVDASTIEIYYYARTSDPMVYVMKETVTIQKIEGEYKATGESLKGFDKIDSKADFEEAYKFGFPDFMEFTAAYQAQADENARNMTEILENPARAAIHQLNLEGAAVSGTYEDRNTDPPIFVVKFAWDDGEVEVNLIQPTLIEENGKKRQASIWITVNKDYNKRSDYQRFSNLIEDDIDGDGKNETAQILASDGYNRWELVVKKDDAESVTEIFKGDKKGFGASLVAGQISNPDAIDFLVITDYRSMPFGGLGYEMYRLKDGSLAQIDLSSITNGTEFSINVDEKNRTAKIEANGAGTTVPLSDLDLDGYRLYKNEFCQSFFIEMKFQNGKGKLPRLVTTEVIAATLPHSLTYLSTTYQYVNDAWQVEKTIFMNEPPGLKTTEDQA